MTAVEIQKLVHPPMLAETVTGALIDGSITYQFNLEEKAELSFTLATPAGESPAFHLLRHDGIPYWYVRFHGVDFTSSKNNVQVGFTRTWFVLYKLGIRDVISGAAAGSIPAEVRPGDLMIMDDFVDFSTHRPRSLPNEIWEKPPHIGAQYVPPLCPELTDLLRQASKSYTHGKVYPSGTFGQFEGHRFESPGEIRMAKAVGVDMVAHHQASEAIYSRELGIHFGALDYVTNIAAGLSKAGDMEFVTHEQAMEGYRQCTDIMLNTLALAAKRDVKCAVCPQPDEETSKSEAIPKEVYF
jgi:5'-methylthioadenosine phosphorylase